MDEAKKLIFDWAAAGPHRFEATGPVMVNDQTLRDGLQSPSVTDPPIAAKLEILHLMEELRIDTAEVSLPGAGARQREAAERLCREIVDQRMRLRPTCSGRTHENDIRPIVDLSQKAGLRIEAGLFIGASSIRQYAEGWTLDQIERRVRGAVSLAVREGLDVMFVTEDTVRSSPDRLRLLLTAAIEEGATRVCLSDTVGAAIPAGAKNLVAWVRSLLDEIGAGHIGIDWHGHRDRGLDVANTLAAIEAGADRVHGTALGIGERIGNTAMEQILVNLKLLGLRDHDLTRLPEYVDTVARWLGIAVQVNSPIVGRDAFRTATGVHAAAVIKALNKHDPGLADLVYSSVPASWIGRRQEIEIGPMSGASNVLYYLRSRGLPEDQETVRVVLEEAKNSDRLLTEEEIMAILRPPVAVS